MKLSRRTLCDRLIDAIALIDEDADAGYVVVVYDEHGTSVFGSGSPPRQFLAAQMLRAAANIQAADDAVESN